MCDGADIYFYFSMLIQPRMDDQTWPGFSSFYLPSFLFIPPQVNVANYKTDFRCHCFFCN